MTWDPITSPCDYILLQGQQSPGLCDIVDASSQRNWDVQKAHGVSGAKTVFTGKEPAKFSVTFRLYTVQDWADWYRWSPIALQLPKRRQGGQRQADRGALEIVHPLLEHVGISSVCVVDVVAPKQTGDGEWTAEIKFLEFREPKPGLAKPDGAQATPVPAADAYEQKIDELNSQVQLERRALDELNRQKAVQ